MLLLALALCISLVSINAQAVSTYQIYFAADNEAKLYVNGKFIVQTTFWQEHVSMPLSLKRGDLVQVYAKDLGFKYGVIAVLAKYSTDGFSRTYASSIAGSAWLAAPYRSAVLPPTQNMKKDSHLYTNPSNSYLSIGDPGSSATFPYCKFPKAQYVWAKGAGSFESILLEHLVA